ncbi:MAG: SPOR domain-containing protein [Pseudomonadota bacterium]
MQKDVNDQELTLKKRARRRLVGAIALVLLMIIILPMVLKDRSIKQPAEEVTITLSNNQQPQVVPETSDFDSNVVPAETESVDVDSQNQSLDSNGEADADPESALDDKKVAVKQPEAPKTDTKDSANAKFYVQIGVFSDEDNVKKLQAKLTDLGYQSQTEKIDTSKGKKIRLRTSLFKERNEAAIALQNIKDAGLTGMVVSQ